VLVVFVCAARSVRGTDILAREKAAAMAHLQAAHSMAMLGLAAEAHLPGAPAVSASKRQKMA
jgi:hypothetical protein